MPNETISQIQLPNGTVYDIISTEGAALEATYDSSTDTLTLLVGPASDADAMGF